MVTACKRLVFKARLFKALLCWPRFFQVLIKDRSKVCSNMVVLCAKASHCPRLNQRLLWANSWKRNALVPREFINVFLCRFANGRGRVEVVARLCSRLSTYRVATCCTASKRESASGTPRSWSTTRKSVNTDKLLVYDTRGNQTLPGNI